MANRGASKREENQVPIRTLVIVFSHRGVSGSEIRFRLREAEFSTGQIGFVLRHLDLECAAPITTRDKNRKSHSAALSRTSQLT